MVSYYREIINESNTILLTFAEQNYINCIILLCVTVGSGLLGVSIYNMVLNGGNTKDLIIFSAGLTLASPLIITMILLILLRICACIAYITCGDSKPTVRVPVVALGDRSGRPKSNSPLSVLRVV